MEVKYCRDTDRGTQEARAAAQHSALAALLAFGGTTVQLHPILLGVGGTVYKDTVGTLEQLGMERKRALALLGDISEYSVQQMHQIVKSRRMMEAQARTGGVVGPKCSGHGMDERQRKRQRTTGGVG